MYSVPLNKLYKIMASCQYNENAEFCPVLIEVIDKKILEQDPEHPYLLQVWSNRGDMLFERGLKKPISNWNISRDKFIFQECARSPIIYLVKLYLDR